jgi:hypothetical protein
LGFTQAREADFKRLVFLPQIFEQPEHLTMAYYDPQYELYAANNQIDAYNMQYIPQKPNDEHVAMDASVAYNHGYMYNPIHNVPGVMDHQEFFLVQQDQVVVPMELWQQQLDYSNATNAQQFESWNP